MPTEPPGKRKSQDRPPDRPIRAPKKPASPATAKSAEKEARLAEALRANLRRRKTRPADEKED